MTDGVRQVSEVPEDRTLGREELRSIMDGLLRRSLDASELQRLGFAVGYYDVDDEASWVERIRQTLDSVYREMAPRNDGSQEGSATMSASSKSYVAKLDDAFEVARGRLGELERKLAEMAGGFSTGLIVVGTLSLIAICTLLSNDFASLAGRSQSAPYASIADLIAILTDAIRNMHRSFIASTQYGTLLMIAVGSTLCLMGVATLSGRPWIDPLDWIPEDPIVLDGGSANGRSPDVSRPHSLVVEVLRRVVQAFSSPAGGSTALFVGIVLVLATTDRNYDPAPLIVGTGSGFAIMLAAAVVSNDGREWGSVPNVVFISAVSLSVALVSLTGGQSISHAIVVLIALLVLIPATSALPRGIRGAQLAAQCRALSVRVRTVEQRSRHHREYCERRAQHLEYGRELAIDRFRRAFWVARSLRRFVDQGQG